MRRRLAILAALLVALYSAAGASGTDPLPSWNHTAAKTNILEFIAWATAEGTPDFVPLADRIAVFDNDGTLWVEQPSYPQFFFAVDRVNQLRAQHPEWTTAEPFKSALARNWDGIVSSGVKGLNELVFGAAAGMEPAQLEQAATNWLTASRHPRYGRPYTQCVYLPMLEVLKLFRAHGFKTYLVTGGAADFVRPWSQSVYGIPPEQVIGSSPETRLETGGGRTRVMTLPHSALIIDREEKPLAIQRVIGRAPVAAFGNSDGDLAMLRWTASARRSSLCVFIHHTDSEREYAYDTQAATGRLDKGLQVAHANGWLLVDMKKDWNRIFVFEP